MEHRKVEFRPLEFVHQEELHVVLLTMINVADAIFLCLQPWKMLIPAQFFIHTGLHGSRDIAVSAEIHHLVEPVVALLLGCSLAQITAQLLVTERTLGRRTNATGEQFGLNYLCRRGRKRVIEIGTVIVFSDIFEPKVKVIVVSIRWNRRLFPVMLLVHLKGTREVLRVTYHGNWYISHEHGTDNTVFLAVEAVQFLSDRVGNAPLVDDDMHLQTLQGLYGMRIFIYLCLGLGMALGVYNDGKSMLCRGCLHRSRS